MWNYENCAGDTDCRLQDHWEVAGKVEHKNQYFITHKNYATRNSMDLSKEVNSKGPVGHGLICPAPLASKSV